MNFLWAGEPKVEIIGKIFSVNSLMEAVATNDIEGVRFFSRSRGSMINLQNAGGATALNIAARNNNVDIVQILLDNGANPNIVDNEGWSALMRAAIANNPKIFDLLLQNKSDVFLINSSKESVIIHTMFSDCTACLQKVLALPDLERKMESSILKDQISSAFVIARNHENQAAQDLLEKYLDHISKNEETDKLKNLQIEQTKQEEIIDEEKSEQKFLENEAKNTPKDSKIIEPASDSSFDDDKAIPVKYILLNGEEKNQQKKDSDLKKYEAKNNKNSKKDDSLNIDAIVDYSKSENVVIKNASDVAPDKVEQGAPIYNFNKAEQQVDYNSMPQSIDKKDALTSSKQDKPQVKFKFSVGAPSLK